MGTLEQISLFSLFSLSLNREREGEKKARRNRRNSRRRAPWRAAPWRPRPSGERHRRPGARRATSEQMRERPLRDEKGGEEGERGDDFGGGGRELKGKSGRAVGSFFRGTDIFFFVSLPRSHLASFVSAAASSSFFFFSTPTHPNPTTTSSSKKKCPPPTSASSPSRPSPCSPWPRSRPPRPRRTGAATRGRGASSDAEGRNPTWTSTAATRTTRAPSRARAPTGPRDSAGETTVELLPPLPGVGRARSPGPALEAEEEICRPTKSRGTASTTSRASPAARTRFFWWRGRGGQRQRERRERREREQRQRQRGEAAAAWEL